MIPSVHWAQLAWGIKLLRITRRPTIRFEVSNVNVLVGTQAALRISHVVVPRGRMALAAAENTGSLRFHSARFSRLKQRNQTLADRRQRRLPKCWMLHPTGLEDRRRQVYESHRIDHVTPTLDSVWPHDGQRHVHAELVAVGLGTRKSHAVVRRHDDQGVVEFAKFIELLQRLGQMRIEPLDLDVVVENIASNFRCVRQESGYFHIPKFLALFKADTLLENSVRFVPA